MVVDPLLDLVTLLRPRAMLTAGIYAAGKWGVSFRQRNDVLFCWIEAGECLLIRNGSEHLHLRLGDFVMVCTTAPFTLASDPSVQPKDSETLVAATKDPVLRLGEGSASTVVVRGGRFTFDAANEQLLTGLLPSLVHLAAEDNSSWRMHSLLKLNQVEDTNPGCGGDFIARRLLEIIFAEILRYEIKRMGREQTGMLAGLNDPVVACALSAMHDEVARQWTVSDLARLCAVSRSTFATRFRTIVGVGPIDYLTRWRITLARDQLRFGTLSIGEIALAIGFQSSSAFSTAFSKAVGCSPREFVHRQVGKQKGATVEVPDV